MARLLIATLGKANYREVCYKLENSTRNQSLLPSELLIDVVKPDKIYIIGTESSGWSVADDRIGSDNYSAVKVPYGVCEDQWWDMLEALTAIPIDEGDEIYLDITHGFRSMPIFCFMALTFFEKINGAKTAGVYYGMLENSSKENINGIETDVTPLVDLAPLLKLRDWIEGYSLYKNYGDANLLSTLSYKDGKSREAASFADNLSRISVAFGFNYVRQITQCADEFRKSEAEIKLCFERDLKPAALFGNKLLEELKRFSTPQNPGRTSAAIHLDLLEWYFEHRRFTQFIILANETLLTYLVENIAPDKVYEYTFRDNVKTSIVNNRDAKKQFTALKKMIDYLQKLASIRNKSGHAEMREELGMKPDIAVDKCSKYLEVIKGFVTDQKISTWIQDNRKVLTDWIREKSKK